MDNLIKELVEEFKKEKKEIEHESEKINNASKIVAKVNENGETEILGVDGTQSALLSTICIILEEMARHSEDSAERMAVVILVALKMIKEIEEEKND